MKLVLLGPPGAGKGTQAQFICNACGIPQISTGDMLRAAIEADAPLGRRMRQVMERGALVSDAAIIALVQERIAQPDCRSGFLFDGFPRTIPQAEALEAAAIPLDAVVELGIPDAQIIERLSGRRVHPGSGRIYHLVHNPPVSAGRDDETGEPLVQRDDDQEETIRERLAVYRRQTQPLIAFYQERASRGLLRYLTVDAAVAMAAVQAQLAEGLGIA